MKGSLNKIKSKYVRKIQGRKKYLRDVNEYRKLVKETNGIPITDEFPCLFDFNDNAGKIDEHYFLQDIHVAELVLKSGIKKHFDIGSRVDGFIAHLLASPMIDEVVMFDIRPFPVNLPKLSYVQADATSLEGIPDNSIGSISSLHAIEHFGLGRYGDTIDPMACFKVMKSIQRVTAKGGLIYISVPITGRDECHFNAHRIFLPDTIADQFDECTVEEIAVLHKNFETEVFKGDDLKTIKRNLGPYDCGIFTFRKKGVG